MSRSALFFLCLLCVAAPSAGQDDVEDEIKGSVKGADGPVRVLHNRERPVSVTVTRAGKPAVEVDVVLARSDLAGRSLGAAPLRSDNEGRAHFQGRSFVHPSG